MVSDDEDAQCVQLDADRLPPWNDFMFFQHFNGDLFYGDVFIFVYELAFPHFARMEFSVVNIWVFRYGRVFQLRDGHGSFMLKQRYMVRDGYVFSDLGKI